MILNSKNVSIAVICCLLIVLPASARFTISGNLGIASLPVAGNGEAKIVNPGNNQSVLIPDTAFTSINASTATAPAEINAIRITQFPVNAVELTIDGTTYDNSSWPVGGVTLPADITGKPTVDIRLIPNFPDDGTVNINFVAIDNSGSESGNIGQAVILFPELLTILGVVYYDVDGLTDNRVDGTVLDQNLGLNVVLADYNSGVVLYVKPVNASDGSYFISRVPDGDYNIILTTDNPAPGDPAPSAKLPNGWVNMGEHIGFDVGHDNNVNGTIHITISGSDVSATNFGIQQPPTAGQGSATIMNPEGGSQPLTVPDSAFTTAAFSSDIAPGKVVAVKIKDFPDDVSRLTIDGTDYTSAGWPAGGVSVPADGNGKPTVDMQIIPGFLGNGDITIDFVAVDNGGAESKNTGYAVLHILTVYKISGVVFNDADGLTDNQVDGNPLNDGLGLNAVAIDEEGKVTAVETVQNDGSYSVSNLPDGKYSVVLTTENPAAGDNTPTVNLPNGWAAMGENLGTGTGHDGTANGILTGIEINGGDISNANFGIQQSPTAGSGETTLVNPGSSQSVIISDTAFTSIDKSTDPAPGQIDHILIKNFPADISSLIIDGNTYTSGSWPSAGVAVSSNVDGLPAVSISITPDFEDEGEVTIEFVAIDNAGSESANTGTAIIHFPTTYNLSGVVFNDADGLTDNQVDGNPLQIDLGLYAITVDESGKVFAVDTVKNTGSYSVSKLVDGKYRVVLTTVNPAVGSSVPAAHLPAGWVYTGENLGTGTGDDGTANGILTGIEINGSNLSDANFGIQQRPAAGSGEATVVNPGSAQSVSIPDTAFTSIAKSTDPAPGQIDHLLIKTFPADVNSLTIDGNSYTSGSWPAGGVEIPSDKDGAPTVSVSISLVFEDEGDITISFVVVDNAGTESSNTGTATLHFPGTHTLKGRVFNDADGLTDNQVDGSLLSSNLGLNAVAIDNQGKVFAVSAVQNNGTYSIPKLPDGQYRILLTTGNPAAGDNIPAIILPTGWASVGEKLGTGTGHDGTADGILTGIEISGGDISNANFGIQERPTAGSGETTVMNPGNNQLVTVPDTTFTNITKSTDPAPGQVDHILIKNYPADADNLIIDGNTYTSGNWPAGGVTVSSDADGLPGVSISVTPGFEDGGEVKIEFVAVDNAGTESANTGTATVSFPYTYILSGHVYNDGDGLTNNKVDGIALQVDLKLFAVAVDGDEKVYAVDTVKSDGSYSIAQLPDGIYSVVITTAIPDIGDNTPVANLPAGWVHTGEYLGSGTGDDGTIDGILTGIEISGGNLSNANFGIQEPPAAGSGEATVVNPGSSQPAAVPDTAFTSIAKSADPTPGKINHILIKNFPADIDNMTIDGNSYTSGSWPVGGVEIPADVDGVPTVAVSVIPDFEDGGTVAIAFVAVDNAGYESSNTGTATLHFPNTYNLNGLVFNDADGLTNNQVDGNPLNNGLGLNAVAVDEEGKVKSIDAVQNDGSYSLSKLPDGKYSVVLTTENPAIGDNAPDVELPSGWASVGEKLGTGTGDDGTADGILTGIEISGGDLSDARFGIQERPVAGSGETTVVNPGGKQLAAVPDTAFTNITKSTDSAPGSIDHLFIKNFPADADTIIIDGDTYISDNWPSGGVEIPSDADGLPAVSISVAPDFERGGTVTITFVAVDNAGSESANTGTALVHFPDIYHISGTVYFDANGMDNGRVDGNPLTKDLNLKVALVDDGGKVVTVALVNPSDGTYDFNNVQNGDYSLVLTTENPAVGAAAPPTTLPDKWENTGEQLGTGTGNDGTVDGMLTGIEVNSSDISDANFGIRQLVNNYFIPNAFTPNGDGNNDIWHIEGNTIQGVSLMVYNQYGQKIFESKNVNTGWDGRYNGVIQPSGVYVYYVKLTFYDGSTATEKGSITLIR